MNRLLLTRNPVDALVAEIGAWGDRHAETGGFLLAAEDNADRATVLALGGQSGIVRRRNLFTISGGAIERLFSWAGDTELRIRAQVHSHAHGAFLSRTDLQHGFDVDGFITAVVPHFALHQLIRATGAGGSAAAAAGRPNGPPTWSPAQSTSSASTRAACVRPEHSRAMRLAASATAQGEASLLEHLAAQHVEVSSGPRDPLISPPPSCCWPTSRGCQSRSASTSPACAMLRANLCSPRPADRTPPPRRRDHVVR